MKLADAHDIAEEIIQSMEGCYERVQICGSIRRQKADVKDIEVVCIPKWVAEQAPDSLLPVEVNLLYRWATQSGIQWIKTGTPDIVPWEINPDGKYWRAQLPDDIKLDLFLCTPENWGIIVLIRTGSAQFSTAVAEHARRCGTRIDGGYITSHGVNIPTREEKDAFDYLGLQWIEPHVRTDGSVLRQKVRVK